MKRLVLYALLSLLLACGRQQEDDVQPASPSTPFGSVATVLAYRERIEPHIRAVTEAQLVVEQQLGSTGQATASNLAAAMHQARPPLQAAHDELQQIDPPARLASLHANIAKLMATRLAAYQITIEGWEQEQTGTQATPAWQQQAEAKLTEANELIAELNEQLQAVDSAVHAALSQQAASP